jgi:hypothetical protein
MAIFPGAVKVDCANPGTVIGAVDFNGAWIGAMDFVQAAFLKMAIFVQACFP